MAGQGRVAAITKSVHGTEALVAEANQPSADPGNTISENLSEHELKRRSILDGAAAVFARRGFSAGTTKEIAAEVGLSQPAIYHYVGSKSDLLREIALQVDRDLVAALESGIARSHNPPEQLRGIIEEYTAAVVRDRHAFAVFWQERRSLPQEIEDEIKKDQREFIAQVDTIVVNLQKLRLIAAGPASVVARAVMSMPSWMYHWYQPDKQMTAIEIADIYCQLIGLEKK